MPESLSLNEAAARLGVTKATARRLIAEGRLASFQTPGGHIRVPSEAIENLRRGGDGHAPKAQAPPSPALLKQDRASELRAELEERRLTHQIRDLDAQQEAQAKEAHEAARAQAEAARREAEAAHLRLQRLRLQQQRQGAREDQERQERQALAAFRDRWTPEAKSYCERFKFRELNDAQRAACLRAGLEELGACDPSDRDISVKLRLEAAVDEAAAPFLAQYAAQELREQVKAKSLWTVDWDDRQRAADLIDEAFEPMAPDVSEPQLRRLASKACAPLLEAAQTRREAEKRKRAKERAISWIANALEVPDHLRELEADRLIDRGASRDEELLAELRETVAEKLETELHGDESEDSVIKRVHAIIDAELEIEE
jgi:excisionase family DNA binding protein